MRITVAALGRLLLSAIFFVSAWRKLDDPAGVAQRLAEATARAAWVPNAVAVGVRDAAPVLAWAAIVFELIGGFCLATGWRRDLGAMLLIVFLVPTTLLFHPPGDPAQLTQFLKNCAILGGLLLVLSPGRVSRADGRIL